MAPNDFQEILQEFNKKDKYTKYVMDIEYEFFSTDNNTSAVRLAMEAKQKGYSNPLFDYVIGFCYNNGQGGLPQNKKKAGEYFKNSADAKDAQGNYRNDKYADECRVILAEDFVLHDSSMNAIGLNSAIAYCSALIEHSRYEEDAYFYLVMIYGRPQFGCLNIESALNYNNVLLQSSNPDMRNKAIAMKNALESQIKKPKKTAFGFWNRH